MSRAPEETDDSVLVRFLSFLARDINAHPERVQSLNPDLVRGVQALTQHVDVDLDRSLSEDDDE